MKITMLSIQATLNRQPFAGEATFSDGKTYTWIMGDTTTFVRWHGPTMTAEHRFAAPQRAAALATALAAPRPRPMPRQAAEPQEQPRRATGGGRLIRPTGERYVQRGKVNTAPFWLPDRSPKFGPVELAALRAWQEQWV